MTEPTAEFTQTEPELSYEEKMRQLEDILNQLDNSEIPIDRLAENVRLGASLITELGKKLKQVETDVLDAFREMEKAERETENRNQETGAGMEFPEPEF